MRILTALCFLVSTGCSGGVATFVVVHDTGDAEASTVPLAQERPDAAQSAADDDAASVQQGPGADAQASHPDAASMAPEQDAGSTTDAAQCPPGYSWVSLFGTYACREDPSDAATTTTSCVPSACPQCVAGSACCSSKGACGCDSFGACL